MTKKELRELIDENIKSNSNRVSPDKTTGMMLKKVLKEIVNTLDDSGSGDSRYHTKIKGEIKLFWGNYFELPKGWVICDGYNGTPDLRGKVPVGWSNGWQTSHGESDLSDYQHLGRMGGTKSNLVGEENLPIHSHPGSKATTTTDLIGSVTRISETFNDSGTTTGVFTKDVGFTGSDTPSKRLDSSPAGKIDINVNHDHDLNITSFGSSNPTPLDNRSPYVVMMYIMYTGETVESDQEKVTWSEYDGSTGVKTKQGDSNSKYGFRYVAPAFYSTVSPDNYSTNQDSEIISNIGFIEQGDDARVLERWLQLTSKGDNLGDDDQVN